MRLHGILHLLAGLIGIKLSVQVVHDVLALNSIARHLRAGRVANGALRLDNTKLFFGMDDDGNPISAAPYGKDFSALSPANWQHALPLASMQCTHLAVQ